MDRVPVGILHAMTRRGSLRVWWAHYRMSEHWSWIWRGVCLAAFVGLGVLLRFEAVDDSPLWVDEAESSINGFGILQHGVPVDRYLGLPIYENMLVLPWPEGTPEHAEYEFRDLSYSDRGVAVYHGWLPLYSIAAAQWALGVEPDSVDPSGTPAQAGLRARHDYAEIMTRTIVPRVPAVIFSAVFLVLMFRAGREIGGEPAGWASLALASLANLAVWFGYQARYYSLTLMLTALVALAIWRVITRGAWRDHALFGLSLVLLFHTHILSAAVAGVTLAVMLPAYWKQPRLVPKLAAALAILLVGTVPWLLYTGFLGHSDGIPKAREIVPMWRHLRFVFERGEAVVLILVPAVAMAAGLLRPAGFLGRAAALFREARLAYVFLLVWGTLIFLAFTGTIPAASYFLARLTLMLEVPGILLAGVILAALARLVAPHHAGALAPVLAILFLTLTGRLPMKPVPASWWSHWWPHADFLRKTEFEDGTRLYSNPNSHLVLQYYTGMPFQSIAPIRREFLESYPGGLVIMEHGLAAVRELPADDVMREARLRGKELRPAEATRLAQELTIRPMKEEHLPLVAAIVPPLRELPPEMEILAARQRGELDAHRRRSAVRLQDLPIFDGFAIRTTRDWWTTFYYRFVDPASRSGSRLNYAGRLREATLTILPGPGGVVMYRIPARERAETAGVGGPLSESNATTEGP